MARLDPEPGAPPPTTATPTAALGGTRRRPTRALLTLAAVTAACSALLLAQAATHPEAAPKAVPKGTTTLNVADAAAVAATSAGSIQIKNYAFAPATATVPTGVTVTWVNEDSVPHTVTSKSGPASFDSGQIAPGASYSAIFETPGTYTYYCIDHPQMIATITVTGGPGGSPSPTPSTAPSTEPSGTPSPKPSSGSPSAVPSMSMSMPAPSASSGGVIGSLGGGSSGSSGGCASLSQVLLPLLQHIDTTHLGESPGQQVNDLLNLDQYVLTHTTLIENMLIPTEGVLTGSC